MTNTTAAQVAQFPIGTPIEFDIAGYEEDGTPINRAWQGVLGSHDVIAAYIAGPTADNPQALVQDEIRVETKPGYVQGRSTPTKGMLVIPGSVRAISGYAWCVGRWVA